VFESAYLSNRIVVMKARPGRVHADVPLITSLERDAHYRTSEEDRMRHENHGNAGRLPQPQHVVVEILAGDLIERGERLV
ncbi:hypothetical protein ACC674_38940, partial [Rhizobium ruizarguesonis]